MADSAAIAPARTIDGSKRVNVANHAINPSVSAHRPTGRSRRSNGPHAAKTNATFCPDNVRYEGGKVPARTDTTPA